MVLSNRAAAKAQAEWVLVGGKESKSVERGWIIVPDKSKDRKSGPIVEEPERADKVLASHGYCKRSEAKAWIRHGRVTFEGDVVKTCDAKVVVRLYDGVCVDGKPVPLTKKESSAKENDENDAPSAE